MIGTTLAHYRITGELGAGGMGEVWRAHDEKLGREVALKVLPEEFSGDPQRLERFEREARAVASLNHPHIVTIYSVEDADGVRFLTMELVDGQTLEGMIPDGGLDLGRFFELATPLAEAISAAHDKSVIHRDLKPANVMVDSDGRVKVMDFGLAKLQEAGDPSDSSELPTEALTGVGMIVGTVPYMSPEQIEGQIVDHRTDIFSLGVLLYEMAIGERPFQGKSSPALMSSILKDAPKPVIELRADLPRHLGRIISRCLEKDRRDRYQTARDVFNELRALKREPSVQSAPSVSKRALPIRVPAGRTRAIAVAPFRAPDSDPSLVTLAEGLTEDISSGLGRFPYLKIIDGAKVGVGLDSDSDSATPVHSVRYLLRGGLRSAGSELRLGVQLVEVETGAHVWSETYDRRLEDTSLFDLQDGLTDLIVATVGDYSGVIARLVAAELRAKHDEDMTLDDWIMRAVCFVQVIHPPEEHAAIRDGLEAAVQRDPDNAEAHAWLANLYSTEHSFQYNRREDPVGRSLRAAQRAVDLDATSQAGWYGLACAHFFLGDLPAFEAAASRAMELNRRNSYTTAVMGLLIGNMGQRERGSRLAQEACALNPHHPEWYPFVIFYDHYERRKYEEAFAVVKRVNWPRIPYTHINLIAVCGQLGRPQEAQSSIKALREDFGFDLVSVREEYTRWGHSDEFIDHLIEGMRKAGFEDGDVPPFSPCDNLADSQRAAPSRGGDGVGIAVLPFADMSPDKDQDYFCEGMAEEIMNALVHVDGIRVASRTSAFRAVEEGKDLQSIGRTLSVGQVLEGSVRMAGGRMRVTAQLTEVESGYQVWSERFDREVEDVFAIQDEIAAGVVEAVTSRLDSGVRTVPVRERVGNLEAYRLYLKGRHYRYSKNDHANALKSYEAAVDLDPTHGPSWVGIAESKMLGAMYNLLPPRQAIDEARSALATSEASQGESAEILYVRGQIAYAERDWAEAERVFRLAVELEPDHVGALCWLAVLLGTLWRRDEAMAVLEHAREVDPLAAYPYGMSAAACLFWGQPGEALDFAEQAAAFEEANTLTLWCTGISAVALGQAKKGATALEEAAGLGRRGGYLLGLYGWALAAAGHTVEAQAVLDELQSRSDGAPTVVPEAWLLAAMGRHEDAWAVLERAAEEHQPVVSFIGYPGYDPLRSDPRFPGFVKRLGLPPSPTSETLVSDAPGPPAGLESGDDHGSDLAVAPFECDRSDPELCSLAIGLEEELTSSFAQFAYLLVRESDAVAGPDPEASGVGEVWRAAGIRYLVTGRLHRVGESLRLSVRLLDTVVGRRLWSENFDSSLSDFTIFELQDHFADRIVATVADSGGVLVRSIADNLRSKALEDYSPIDWVMRTFAYWNQMREEEHAQLREGLESAVKRDAHRSAIWACLAQTYLDEFRTGFNPRNGSLDRALEAALKAVELDPRDSLAQESLADVHFFRRDLTAFQLAVDRALAINPRDATTTASMGTWLALSGELQRGFDLTVRAMKINPDFAGWYQIAIFFYHFGRDEFEKALAASKSMNMPDFFWSHLMTAAAAGKLGLENDARAAVRRLEALFAEPARDSRREAEKFIVPEGLLASFLDGLERAGLGSEPVLPVDRSCEGDSQTPGIAVLPFADHSAGDDQEWIAAGTHEALLTALQQIGGLRVTSRTSSMQYRDTTMSLKEIANELGVGWLVEGSVTQVGDRMRVVASLVEASTDQQAWANQYESDIRDILAQQNKVAREIAGEVQVVVTPEEDLRLAQAQRVDPAAYGAYVRGLHHFDRVNPADFKRCIELFEESTSLDPKFAPAHAGLAAAYGIGVEFGWVSRAEAAPLAEHALRAVQRIDPQSASAFRALANVQFHIRRDLGAAEESYRKASELESNAYTLFEFGWLLSQCGRHEEAVAVLEEVVAVDPRSPLFRCDLGWWTFGARDYERAIGEAQYALELDPSFAEAHWLLAISYAELERYDDALAELERYEVPSGYSVLWYRGYILALAGRRDEALEVLEKLEKSGAPHTERAYILLGLDDRAGVLEALEQADGSDIAFQPYLWPRYATYHDDPRFRALLEKFGLPLPSNGDST